MDNMVFILLALGATSLPGLGIIIMYLAEMGRQSEIRQSNSAFRAQLTERALRDLITCHDYPPITICKLQPIALPFQILRHHGIVNPAAGMGEDQDVVGKFHGFIWGVLVFQFLVLAYVLFVVKRSSSVQVSDIAAKKAAKILGSAAAAGTGLMKKYVQRKTDGRGGGGSEKEKEEDGEEEAEAEDHGKEEDEDDGVVKKITLESGDL